MSRVCSASPGLPRSLSPLGVSVAQRHAQLAEHVAESAMSGVGRVVDETCRVRKVADAAIAEAKSIHSEVKNKVASLLAHATVNTAHALEVLSGRVQEVTAHSEAQALRIVETVTQQWEKEIEAAATSAATTAELNTRIAMEGMR